MALQELSERQKGLLSACAGIVILSPDTLLIRLSSPPCPPNEMMFWRFLISALTLLFMTTAFTAYKRDKVFESTEKETHGSLFSEVVAKFTGMSLWMWIAAVAYAAGNLCFVFALELTYVASVLVVMATSSIFGSIFSFILLSERMKVHTAICCVTCIGAIVLIFSQSLFSDIDPDGGSNAFSPSKTEQMLGTACALGVAITSGAYYTTLRYVKTQAGGKDIDLIPVNFMSCFMVTSISLFLPHNGITRGVSYMATGGSAVPWLVLQGTLCLPLSFTLLANASARIRSAEISMIMTFETVAGPVWVSLAGYEGVPTFTVYGGTVIVIALLLHEYVNLQYEKQEADPAFAAIEAGAEDGGDEGIMITTVDTV